MANLKANITQENVKVSVIQNVIKAIVKDAGAQGIQGIQGVTGAQGVPGIGIPTGGLPGQIIRKVSSTDFDASWQDNLLSNLNDVNISSPLIDQILKYNGSQWINATNAGAGNSNVTIEEIDGIPAIPNVQIIRVTNGKLTNNGGGDVTLDLGGSGDIVGPSSATDNAIPRFDTTTGKLLQGSSVLIDDSNNISGVGTLATGQITQSGVTLDATYANVSGDTFTGLIQFSGTTHAGIKLNSLTTTQRDALTPSNGMLIYNSTTGTLQKYQAGSWLEVAPVISVNGQTGVVSLTTSDISEGSNLYYTDARVRLNRLDQLAQPTSFVSFNSQKITSLLDPTSAQDAATKAYVDSVATGLDSKASCRVATTVNITLSGTQTIDGVSVIANDRVLVKNQTDATENGIYVCASGAWSRSTDADEDSEVGNGLYTLITAGTTQANTGWVLTTPGSITLGTTPLTFSQFSSVNDIIAGNGLIRTVNTLDIVGTTNRITINADSIDISSSYVGQSSIATLGTISTGIWSATTIAVNKGGTGQTTYTDGQLLIGNTNGNILTKATLTGTSNQIIVTNGNGSITLSAPQDINTGASPTFAGLNLGTGNLNTIGNIYLANGNTDRVIGADATHMRTTSGAGRSLTFQAGGALSGGTDLAGGNLILSGGIATGQGSSSIIFEIATAAGSSGSGDRIPSEVARITQSGATGEPVNFGIGISSPTAGLHLRAGTASEGTAPLKFTAGTDVGTPEAGAMEYTGAHLYFTIGSTRYQIDQQFIASMIWGNISGTLSNQTDLQAALDAKVTKAGDAMTGNLLFSSGLQTQQASYTLFISGSTYKAQNGSTNAIDYSGTNFYTIFNNVLSALSSGGSIFIRAGTYLTSTEINISTSNITIEGEGMSTILKAANSANIRSVLAISGTGTTEVKLRNFCVDGNKANQSSGDGIYVTGPTSSNCGIVLEDILIQNCKNNGFAMSGNPGTSSMYFTRVRSTTNDSNGFYFPYNLGAALTDSVFDSCIADTNALNGFYLSVLDSHFFACKAYYNGSAGGNNHGITIAGYNNFFVDCEAQDNYQSGFYSENAGDPTYGAEYCTFTNCTGNNNGQTGGVTYACGLQAINVKGWQVIGGVYNTHPYPSFIQRIGVSLEGTTTLTRVISVQGENNSDSLYKDTSSGANYPLHIPGVTSKLSDDMQAGTHKISFGTGYINSTDTQNLVFDSGTSRIQFQNFSEIFFNGLNKNISLYNASDNTLGITNTGGGKAHLDIQNQLTFGYGEYLGVSPASSWPSGTHKLIEVSYNGSNDQVDFYTPGSQRSTSLLTLTSDGKITGKTQIGFTGTTNPGLILNSLTTTQRDALTATSGNLIYNSTLAQVQNYANNQWTDISKSPATKVVAPAGSGYAADYYTDGTNDDVEILAALTALSGGNGTVLLKLGTYNVRPNQIIMPINSRLVGEGWGTLLQLNSAGKLLQFVSDNTQPTGFRLYNNVENLRLDGGTILGATGIYCGLYGQEFNVKDCWFYNFGNKHDTTLSSYCIDAGGTNKKFQIIGNWFGGSAVGNSMCIRLSATGDVQIVGNNFHDFYEGIHGNTEKTQIVDNDIYAGDTKYGQGINIGTSGGGLQTVNIIGNTFSDVAYGVRIGLSTGKGANIVGNFFRNINKNAIYLRGSNNTVANNYFGNISSSGIGNDAIGILVVDANYINVHDNTYDNGAGTNMSYFVGLLNSVGGNLVVKDNHGVGAQSGVVRYPATIDTNNSILNIPNQLIQTYVNKQLSGDAAYLLNMHRNMTSNTAGNSFTIQAGAATTRATNKNGGTFIIKSGISTGSGTSQIQFQTYAATTNTLATISSYVINNLGSGYTVNDVLTVTGGGGTGGTITVNSVAPAGQINNVVVNNAGTGYVVGDTLTVPTGTGSTITVTGVLSNGAITNFSLVAGGTGYSTTSNVSVTGGTGTGATFDISVYATGAILTSSLTTPGTGYALTVGASTTGGTGAGATLDIVVFDNADNTASTKMTILGSGNVGIGTTTPGYLLDVNGNLNASKLSLGSGSFNASLGEFISISETVTDTASGAAVVNGIVTTINPASNSSSEFRTTNLSARGLGSSNISTIHGIYLDTRQGGSGNITSAIGLTVTGSIITNATYAGTITSATGLSLTAVSQSGNPTGGVVTTGRGILINDSSVGTGGLAITTLIGIDITALTKASTSNIGFRIAAPSGATNNYALQLSDTGATAAGGITFGTDTQVYRSAANVLTFNSVKLSGLVNPTSAQDAATKAYVDGIIGAVNSITGTANQVIASSSTGNVTLSLPQSIGTGSSPTFAGLSLGSGSLNTVGNIELDNTATRDITVVAKTTGGGTGTDLTITAGQSETGVSNTGGGKLVLRAGQGTGNAGGQSGAIIFDTPNAGGSGTSTQAMTQRMYIANNGRIFIGSDTAPAGTSDLTFNANAQRTINMNRHTTSNTAGNNFVLQAGGATSGATDKNAGNVVLASGVATGTGSGSILFQTSKAQGSTNTTDNAVATVMTLDGTGNLRIGDATAPTATLDILGKYLINSSGLNSKYNNVTTVGWGTPAIYGMGRATAQTAANASVSTYTVGAADGSFLVSANVLVTTSSAENFTVTVSYTDEGNTARVLTLNFQTIAGVVGTAVAFANGAVPYEGVAVHLRCKASTAITIKTAAGGTYTGVVYNVEGMISQIA